MTLIPQFNGFPRESVDFYRELTKNNSKSWFDAHKDNFEKFVMAPARDFVFHMGIRLQELSPEIIADPRINKSIFRPYRDTRFSKDKTPYKTHLGIFFWEGTLPKMECAGYYFHLEPPHLRLAEGIHCFSKRLLEQYRNSVVHPEHGSALSKAIEKVEKNKGYSVGGEHYKKTPRGYDPLHVNANLLLYDGLYVSTSGPIPDEFFSPDLLDFCFSRFKKMSPLHEWLVQVTARI
jgi:uncharacterized protein (TIGR02453 family)